MLEDFDCQTVVRLLCRHKPTLLLLHVNLHGNADGVLRIGLRHRAMIDRPIFQRTHTFAQMEHMRLR